MPLMLAEQVLAAFETALKNQVPGVDGRVERDREDAVGEEEYAEAEAAVVVHPESEASRMLAESVDDNEVNVNVEIFVRAKQGAGPWTTRANAFAVLVHARLMAYAWPGFVARVRKTGTNWGADEAGRTPGKLTLSYAVRYLSSARAIDASPNQP